MTDRRVTQTGKDTDGDITKLCNPRADWSPRPKAGAIRDIDAGIHTYHVQTGTRRTEIQVVKGQTGKYLRTTGDSSDSNNLDNLPDC